MESKTFNEIVIVKRSGQRVGFNGTKIAIAIKNAFDSVYENYDKKIVNKIYENVLDNIERNYEGRKTINVEDIQNIIETELKLAKQIDVYEAFNSYRLKRAASREVFSIKQQHKFVKAMEKLILTAQNDTETKALDTFFKFGKTVSSEFSKAYLLDSKFIREHEEGNLYINNLEYYGLGVTKSSHLDFSKLLVENPEDSFRIIEKTILNVKKEQYGEQTIPAIDYILVPYVLEKYKTLLKNIFESHLDILGISDYFNLRKFNESIDALKCISEDEVVTKYLLNNQVRTIYQKTREQVLEIISNDLADNFKNLISSLDNIDGTVASPRVTISLGTNTTKEGKLIIESYLENLPITKNVTTIFKIKKKINLNDKDVNYRYLLRAIELLQSEYNIKFAFLDASFNKFSEGIDKEVEYFSDGTRIYENVASDKIQSVGRIDLATVTLNLARIGIKLKKGIITDITEELSNKLEIAKNYLLQAFEIQASKYTENYQYLFNDYLILASERLEERQRVRKIIKNGNLNIGIVGLRELVYLLKKDTEQISPKNFKGLNDILKFIRQKCQEFSEETKLNFVLKEITDDEVLKELESIDKSVFGVIPNVTDSPSYKPLYHLSKDLELIERLKIEEEVQRILNGGHCLKVFLNKKTTVKQVLDVLEQVSKYDIGFVEIIIGKRE